jgi:hypothetical protein
LGRIFLDDVYKIIVYATLLAPMGDIRYVLLSLVELAIELMMELCDESFTLSSAIGTMFFIGESGSVVAVMKRCFI